MEPEVNITEMMDCLSIGMTRLKDLGRLNKLLGVTFKAAKNGKGINCFCRLSALDEIELF